MADWWPEYQWMSNEVRRLREAIEQIKLVCEDNARVSAKGKGMALDFVRQIAASVTPAPHGTEREQGSVIPSAGKVS